MFEEKSSKVSLKDKFVEWLLGDRLGSIVQLFSAFLQDIKVIYKELYDLSLSHQHLESDIYEISTLAGDFQANQELLEHLSELLQSAIDEEQNAKLELDEARERYEAMIGLVEVDIEELVGDISFKEGDGY